jgi:Arc/MetJ-type ribon-helix-helix transcriptional regulator
MASGEAIDRAFELAKSGQYRSVSEIIRRLRPEDRHAVEAHLTKPNARRELILVCSEAWLERAN